jgi:hypothetical protein
VKTIRTLAWPAGAGAADAVEGHIEQAAHPAQALRNPRRLRRSEFAITGNEDMDSTPYLRFETDQL